MLTQKQKNKIYLQGYKAIRKKSLSQNDIDLMTVKKINDYAFNGKIAVLNSGQCFYDSYDYNVEGYEAEYTRLIPASYTAYRHFLNQCENCADTPYYVEIVKQQTKGK